MNHLYQSHKENLNNFQPSSCLPPSSFHPSSNHYSFFHAEANYRLDVQQLLPGIIFTQDQGKVDEQTFFFSKHALREVLQKAPYTFYVCDLSMVNKLSKATIQLILKRSKELFPSDCLVVYVVDKAEKEIKKYLSSETKDEKAMAVTSREEAYKLCMKHEFNKTLSETEDLMNLDRQELINIIKSQNMQQEVMRSGMVLSSDQTKDALGIIRKKISKEVEDRSTPSSLQDIKSLLDNFEKDILKQLHEKEDALNRKTAKLYSVIESTDMCVGLLDLEGNVLDCNRHFTFFFEDFFGYQLTPGQKALKDDSSSVFHQNWRNYFKEAVKGEPAHFSEILTSRGKSAILNIKFFPILQDHLVNGVSCFIQDHTQRKQEESLFRLLNSAVVHTNDAILVTEVKSLDFIHEQIIYVNHSFSTLTGYEEEEVMGKSHNILYGALTSVDELDKINHAVQSGEPVRTEIVNYRKNGSHFWVNFSLVPLKNEKEEITHWIYILRDIEARKEAEESVLHHKQFLDSVTTNIKEAIIRTDEQKKFLFTNQSFRELFGYQNEEIKLEDLFAVEGTNNIFEKTLLQGSINNQSFLFKRKDGSTFWGLTSFIINEYQGVKYYDGAIRDITERKEAERVLQEKNTALQKTNEELDRFVYSASHDLRAPLASSLGLINISRITQDENERISYLNMMEQSLNKMDKIIQDITDYSRNARLEIECEEIYFESLIADVIQRLKYLEHIDDVNIHTFVEGETKFYTDKIRLYVVLINLISNAIKYHKYNDSNPFINIKVNIKAEKAHILVEDNGIGIEEKHLDKIFGMFFQAARESSGSGLGLFVVKETINKLEGTIHVQSKLKEGTCFEVILPNAATKC